MKDITIKKLYYSIGEVSDMTQLKPYVLRYWESEFSELKPTKNRAGKRIYRLSDIELINQIKNLLYTEQYTIKGAKQRMRSNSGSARQVEEGQTQKMFLREIKNGLQDILNILCDTNQIGA